MLRHLAETSTTTWHQFSLYQRWLMITTLWRHFRYLPDLPRSSSTCLRPLVSTMCKVEVSPQFTASTWNLAKLIHTVLRLTGSTADWLNRTGTSVDSLVQSPMVTTGQSISPTTMLNITSTDSDRTLSRRPGIAAGLSVTTRTLPPAPGPRLLPAAGRTRSASPGDRHRRRVATCVTASISKHLLTSRSPTPTH